MNYAIIGFGGLGKVHFKNSEETARRIKQITSTDIKLVALCDVDEKAFRTKTRTNLHNDNHDTGFDLSDYHLYTDVHQLFAKETLDFVITALPTYLHEEIAVMAMERGIHVFSEKPMALSPDQGQHMLKMARENKVTLMIGQCVRYFPAYVMLKQLVSSETYGKVLRADFHRLSPMIKWSWQNWMLDDAKSGGAVLDLHVHDVDFIQYAFGLPQAVTSVVTNHKLKYESVSTLYHYEDKLVTATADWSKPASFSFTAGFMVHFERALVILNAEGFKIYPETGDPYSPELPAANGYAEEVIDFINCVIEKKESSINPPEASYLSMLIALAEKESADSGKTITLEPYRIP